jgi:ferric-dicitrate binding protein FerR (iron transport regulator)
VALLNRDLRASDLDRERAVAFLKAHYAEGRLTSDELAWRSDAAYRAVGMAELRRLSRDLPAFARPPRRRRSRALPLALLVLALVALIVLVPPELLLGLFLLLTAIGIMLVFVLAPVWIPVMLGFIAYRVFCAARRSVGPRPAGWR